jgi:(p)ppGpp synthase/HD superfamily hydrolase
LNLEKSVIFIFLPNIALNERVYEMVKLLYKIICVFLCLIIQIIYIPYYAFALRPASFLLSKDTAKKAPQVLFETGATGQDNPARSETLPDAVTDEPKWNIDDVYTIAGDFYKGKVLSSGETYFEHTKRVASSLSQLKPDISQLAIAAALLHKIPIDELKQILRNVPGLNKKQQSRIIDLVVRMNNVSRLPYLPPPKTNFTIQNQMNMIVQMAGEPDVMLLVFADKLQIFMPVLKSGMDYVYREITHIYAPLAERLGLDYLASYLREEAFKLNSPETYNEIRKQVEQRLGMSYAEASDYLQQVADSVREELSALGIEANVFVRVKNVYSVYEKTQSTEKTRVEDIDDLFGIRIIVRNESDLWNASDITFSTNLFDRFSGGESELKRARKFGFELFDRVIRDDFGRPYEFQFMTEDNLSRYMSGVAAHWSYKMKRETAQRFDTDAINISGDFNKDFTALKESLSRWVFIFRQMEETGKIALKPLRLPAGSIPADFAALRDIDALNKDYRGAVVYRKEYDVDTGILIVLSKIMRKNTYQFQPGELADILVQEGFLRRSNSARYDIGKNARTLRAHVLLNNLTREQLNTRGEEGRRILKDAGFPVNIYAINDFLRQLVIELGLKDEAELYAALSSTNKFTADDIKDYARKKGRQMIENMGLNLNNRIAIMRLELARKDFSLNSLDELFIAVGTGQIMDKVVYERLYSSRPIDIMYEPNQFAYAA